MTKIKCKKCDVWLFSAAGEIDIEIHCKKCKYMNRFKMRINPHVKVDKNLNKALRKCGSVMIDASFEYMEGMNKVLKPSKKTKGDGKGYQYGTSYPYPK